jgi:hypothetical protein
LSSCQVTATHLSSDNRARKIFFMDDAPGHMYNASLPPPSRMHTAVYACRHDYIASNLDHELP